MEKEMRKEMRKEMTREMRKFIEEKRKLEKETLKKRNAERWQAMRDRPSDFPAWQHERWYSEKELDFIKLFGRETTEDTFKRVIV